MFQKTLLNQHHKQLDSDALNRAYDRFTACFHNADKQANIRASKEEQYQEGFLRDLFVDIFGYTLNPEPDYDLTTEFKNQTGAKKADGAILKDGSAIAVIELKGMDTTDLGKVEAQAFGYKNNQPQCRYVITSNFQKLRFYIDNAVEFIEFDLFTLSQSDFATLYTLLHRDSLFADVPKTLKNASLSQEESVTKQLYKNYAGFKRALFADLTANNPDIDALELFKKSQKLLDRLLFIFFAEDSGLLPANFARNIIVEWDKLKDLNAEQPLYQRFKQYFNHLNTGYKNRNTDIFAYNGGLFAPDAILDAVTISDEVLEPHIKTLADYDFASEVDVNILGHIFENSLGEIDEIKAQLAGTPLDKAQTKRKKDGVFYTPKYITKYIVEQTVGKLCADKKAELGMVDEAYQKPARMTEKAKEAVAKNADKLTVYRDWLLQITICDPACGSGAFLNEALSFLIAEHAYIDELASKLYGDSLVFKEVENHILENNLFGVDINEESVEIAKLSLWLRTAKPKRKLNRLSNNIKCGNSLIDDPEIAGDKAFDWAREFPQVFGYEDETVPPPSGGRLGGGREPATKNDVKNSSITVDNKSLPHPNPPPLGEGTSSSGFDVIIGNPPYVQLQKMKAQSAILKMPHYQTYDSTGDLYCLFYERGNQLLKSGGLLGYITSNKWMRTGYGKPLRQFFTTQTIPLIFVDLGANIFESATVDSNILIFQKHSTVGCTPCTATTDKAEKMVHGVHPTKALDLSKETNFRDFNAYDQQAITVSYQGDEIWTIESPLARSINAKLTAGGMPLKDWDIEINYGIKTGYNDAFFIDSETKDRLIAEDAKSAEVIKPLLRGRDIKPYHCEFADSWLINLHNGYDNFERLNAENYPAIKAHLDKYYERLEKRYDKGDTPYNLRNCAYLDLFAKEKIIYPNMTKFLPFFYDDDVNYFINDKAFLITGNNLKYLLACLNSQMSKYWIRKNCPELGSGESPRYELRKVFFEHIPIPSIDDEAQQPFIEKADQMLTLNADLQAVSQKFLRMLAREFDITAPNKKLQSWYALDDKAFFTELEKDRKKAFKANNGTTTGYQKLSLGDKADWEDYFLAEKTKAEALTAQINATDRDIDNRVYALYGLTDEEIALVERG